ncbi:GAF domain-containing protein [Pedobacter foliorum]|uniref:GAF domain-containing protein n=1 Tax=Pedobacter foliorum TaxID=2739058 RepID=UPI001564A454|nr:GAF domain-containing protein [Pedobacter foliorum]NRF39575.1 GAF domain-containing protein [Pedobacter foliorum]
MENIFGRDIIPSNEVQRVAALKRYHLIHTPPEPVLDQIVQLAAKTFDTPMALISLVDVDHVFFKATIGVQGLNGMARGKSLCSIAILDTEPLIIHYAENKKCLLNNPIIAAEFGLKFYASAPLTTPDGFTIGVLCIVDTKPRGFTTEQIKSLKDMADLVMKEIENRNILDAF